MHENNDALNVLTKYKVYKKHLSKTIFKIFYITTCIKLHIFYKDMCSKRALLPVTIIIL